MRMTIGWLVFLGAFVSGCGQEYAVSYPEALKAIKDLYPEKRDEEASTMPAYSQTIPTGAKGMTVHHKEVTPGQEYCIYMNWIGVPDYRMATVRIRKSDKGVTVTVRSELMIGPTDLTRDLPIPPIPWSRDMRHEEECQKAIGQVLEGLAKGGS